MKKSILYALAYSLLLASGSNIQASPAGQTVTRTIYQPVRLIQRYRTIPTTTTYQPIFWSTNAEPFKFKSTGEAIAFLSVVALIVGIAVVCAIYCKPIETRTDPITGETVVETTIWEPHQVTETIEHQPQVVQQQTGQEPQPTNPNVNQQLHPVQTNHDNQQTLTFFAANVPPYQENLA